VPFSLEPHYRSDHPEATAIEEVVAEYERLGLPYRTLRDGEAILAEGTRLR